MADIFLPGPAVTQFGTFPAGPNLNVPDSVAGFLALRHGAVAYDKNAAAGAQPLVLAAQKAAAIDSLVSGAGSPRIATQVARIGAGSNFAYVNSGNAGAAPTVILPRTDAAYTSSDILLPAQAGDRIEFVLMGRITVAAGAGLVLSIWSVGGKQFRDVGTGSVGLQTVAGIATLAAGSSATLRIPVNYVVHADDIDENGFVVFRLFGANAANGPATHTFIGTASGGVVFRWFGANVRRDASAQPALTRKYPTGIAGANLAFQTTGATFGIPTPVDPTGASDLVVPVTALDVLRFELDMRYTAAVNLRLILGVLKDGAHVRNPIALIPALDSNGPLLDPNSGTQTVGTTAVFRVRDTDIAANGTVTLRLYATSASGPGTTQNHTILGSDNLGGYSHMRVYNYGSPFRWALTPTYSGWDNGPSTAAGSQQESGVWQDNTGRWNMIVTATPGDYMGWAWTDDLEKGVWTKHPSPILGQGIGGISGSYNRGSVLYENGIVYIYSRGYAGGGIGCSYGPSPLNLTNAGLVLTSAPSGYTTLENTKVVKGSDGAYWMWFEGIHTATTRWQIGLAKSPSPLGPFVHVAAPLTSLQVLTDGVVSSPDVAFTGRGYQMVYHATPRLANVPSMVYMAKSADGQNWTKTGIGADGTPNGVLQPLYEHAHAQTADPSAVVHNGRTYLFVTAQANGSPEQGGIMVTDPLAWPIPYGT